jgi:hypothetical protein
MAGPLLRFTNPAPRRFFGRRDFAISISPGVFLPAGIFFDSVNEKKLDIASNTASLSVSSGASELGILDSKKCNAASLVESRVCLHF